MLVSCDGTPGSAASDKLVSLWAIARLNSFIALTLSVLKFRLMRHNFDRLGLAFPPVDTGAMKLLWRIVSGDGVRYWLGSRLRFEPHRPGAGRSMVGSLRSVQHDMVSRDSVRWSVRNGTSPNS